MHAVLCTRPHIHMHSTQGLLQAQATGRIITSLLLNSSARVSPDQGHFSPNHSEMTAPKETNAKQAFILQLIVKFYKLVWACLPFLLPRDAI